MKREIWLILLSIVASAAAVDLNYTVTVSKDFADGEAGIVKEAIAAAPGATVTSEPYFLVDLQITPTVAEPEAAVSGEATTSVAVTSNTEAVVAYEVNDLVVYDEETIKLSALEGYQPDSRRGERYREHYVHRGRRHRRWSRLQRDAT